MEANELRIGDYVYDEEENLCKIETITSDKQCVFISISSQTDGFNKIYPSNIFPIRLTEEFLLKIGAKKYLPSKVIYDRFCLSYLPGYHYWYVTDKESRCYITKIEFVHELQNMIFALNGEELEVKQ